MIAFLLFAAASATAVDAERAFAADSQRIGQWTAFRKWGDRYAVMFTPQAVWAQTYLKGEKDPPKSVRWWPAQSFVSCDGRTAVNTGPWIGADPTRHGYFTTVWQRSGRDWRWVYDGGDRLTGSSPTIPKVQVHRASCRTAAPGAPIPPPPPLTNREALTTPEDNGRGQSADKTLGWDWKVEKSGARKFRVYQWNGKRYVEALANDIAAPPSK